MDNIRILETKETESAERTFRKIEYKKDIIVNYQSSWGKWPAPSIILSLILVGFSFWNSSATDWGKCLSDTPQARSIGLSHLILRIQLVTLKCIKRNAQVNCMRNNNILDTIVYMERSKNKWNEEPMQFSIRTWCQKLKLQLYNWTTWNFN